MVYTWVDYAVVIPIIIVGLVIMYRALKEPLDLLFGLVGRGIKFIVNKLTGMGSETYETRINYG